MTTLAWPPPGLRDLEGRFRSLTRWSAAASCFILAASIGFAAYVPDEFWFSGGRASQLFIIWGGIGVLIMLGAAFSAWRDVARATFAVRRGYTWLTIAEVMTDHAGDAGALIGGEREYSAVTPQVRGAIRMARVVSSVLLLAAAALPIPVMVLLGWSGAEVPSSQWLLMAIVLAPSFVLVVVSAVVGRVERFAFRESRLGHPDELDARDARKTVVEPWYAAFDNVRAGQLVGRGRAGGAFIGWAINSAACVALALIVASMVPLWMVSMTAPAVFSWQGMRNYTNSGLRIRTFAPLRALIPAVDASVTPTQAGSALHSLSMRGAAPQPPIVRRPAVALPSFPEPPDSLYPNMRSRSLAYVYGGAFPSQRGLDQRQREYLTRLSASPGADLLHLAARAQRADFADARFATPFADSISPFAIPPDPSIYTLDTLGWAQVGRAKLLNAYGGMRDAESVIADVIAIGFHLSDDGITFADESEGTYLVQIGASALRTMYAANPAMTAKMRWIDSILRPPSLAAPGSPAARTDPGRAAVNWTTSPTRAKLLAALNDTVLPRSRRFGMTRAAGMLACTNAREILFGPTRALRDAITHARKDLVRSPAEGALFDLNAQAAERPYHAKPGPEGFSLDQVLLLRTARIAGLVLRNKRIAICAELGVGARQLGG